jgi:hypothetical protein
MAWLFFGDPFILACYSAAGRDEAQYAQSAARFDINHASGKHLAFGGGIHFCLGASLARLEGIVALRGLFSRYRGMTLAADPASLPPVPSLFSNSARLLPVRLGEERRPESEMRPAAGNLAAHRDTQRRARGRHVTFGMHNVSGRP